MKVRKRTPARSRSRDSAAAKRSASSHLRWVTKLLSWAKLQKPQVALQTFVIDTLQMAGPPRGTNRRRSSTPGRPFVISVLLCAPRHVFPPVRIGAKLPARGGRLRPRVCAEPGRPRGPGPAAHRPELPRL